MLIPLHMLDAHKPPTDPGAKSRLGLSADAALPSAECLMLNVLSSVLTARQPPKKRCDIFQSRIDIMYSEFRYRVLLNLEANFLTQFETERVLGKMVSLLLRALNPTALHGLRNAYIS